jgi:hypothetical protein
VVIVRKFMLSITVGVLTSLIVVASALAVPVLPAVPVAAYGDSILSGLATAIGDVLPYAATVTAFAIGVGMIRRWLGHRKATSV